MFFAADDPAAGTYDVYAHDNGTDTRLTPDGSAIAFRTSEALTRADEDAAADVYVAGPAGFQLVSPGTSRGVGGLIGFTGTHLAFRTDEALTCADEDTGTDVYVAQGATVGLATPGTANDVVEAQLAPDGDVVYVDVGERGVLYRTTASTGCGPAHPGGTGPGEAVTVTLRGRAPRRCGRASCGRRSRLIVRSPEVGTVTVRIRRGKRSTRLVSRSVGAGLTTVRLPYLPRAFKPGKRYQLRVRLRPIGEAAVVRTLMLRVR